MVLPDSGAAAFSNVSTNSTDSAVSAEEASQQQADSTNKTDLAGTEAAVEDAVPEKTGSMDAGSAMDSDQSD